MQGNDIAPTTHKHVACWFEDLLVQRAEELPQKKRLFDFRKYTQKDDPDWIKAEVRKWSPNDLPIKSVYHMVNQLDIGVEVYTYLDSELVDAIEHYLARKGISVQVYSYFDIVDLDESFRYNRDVHTLFTPYEEDARTLGFRATVVRPDGTFGF